MSSTGRIVGNARSDSSRRPVRERKQAQHFGHSAPCEELEELVSRLLFEMFLSDFQADNSTLVGLDLTNAFQIGASAPRKVAPAVGKAGKWPTRKPSLCVKLPLPAPTLPGAPLLPLSRSSNAPEIKIESSSEAPAGPSSRNPKKRTAAQADDDDISDLFTPSPSRVQAPKKKPRLQPSIPKPRATPKVKALIKSEVDDRPEPRGQPEVWAEVSAILSWTWLTSMTLTLLQERQALCEALPYYQAYQSGAYSWGSENGKGGYVYGFLLDNDNDERGYMDENIAITRT